jgi:glycogen synthase
MGYSMNLVFVITQFPPNITAGLGRYAESIYPYLVAGNRLSVFTVNDGRLPRSERQDGLTVHRPMGKLMKIALRRRSLNRTRRGDFALLAVNVLVSNIRHYWGIRREHRRSGVDIIAIHDVTNFICAFLCYQFLEVPLVFHLHTTEYSLAPRKSIIDPFHVARAIERRLGRIAKRVITPTREIRDLLVADGWNPDTIDVVSLGNPMERVLDTPRRKVEVPAEASGGNGEIKVLLFVGRLELQKGIFVLLAAMRQVVAVDPTVMLVVIGHGDRARVEALTREYGLTGNVYLVDDFLGMAELADWYVAAEACIFPSLYEPFGLVAVEAMSWGKPVILGDGFSQVFLGNSTDPAVRYVPATDPVGIAETIVDVMSDPQLRRSLGGNAQRLVQERFLWRRTAQETLDIYRQVTDGQPAK